MIITFKQLEDLRVRFKNKRIAFSGGTFDVFHPTHVKTFKNLKKYGDIVVIGIVSDKRVKQRKGATRPILNQKERLEIVESIKYVDYALIMPEPTQKNPIPTMKILSKLQPDIFISIDENWNKYKKSITDLGIILKIVKRIHPTSSTSIIERILNAHNK